MNVLPSPTASQTKILAQGSTSAPRVAGGGGVVVWSEIKDGCSVVMKYDHGTISQVSEPGYDCAQPAVSDDGRVIAYARLSPGHDGLPGSFDIYQCRDGVTSVVADLPGNEFSTEISGDGRTIAWDDDMGSNWTRWRIGRWQDGVATLLTDGQRLTEFPFIANGSNRVLFREQRGGRSIIAGERPDGTVGTIAAGPGNTIWPDATSDAGTLLWSDNTGENDTIVRFQDGKATTVVADEGVDHTWARFNDDGSRMVWTAFDRRDPVEGHPKVTVRLREAEQEEILAKGAAGLVPVMPDMSNDGSTVAWLNVDVSSSGAPSQVVLLERTPGVVSSPAPRSGGTLGAGQET